MLESIIISTLAGSIICSALLIFKNKLLSLLGGKALYYISLIAMLVFILPMNIGDISLTKVPVNQAINVTGFEATLPETNTNTAPVQTTPLEAPQEVQHNAMPQPSNLVRRSNPITMQEILLAVWLLGFIISMCRYFISYFRFKKKICGFDTHDVIDGLEIIKSPLISSPLVFGFFRPTLAIPEIEMNEDDYNLAIKHEMVHYKHHDSWFKLFAVIVNSICWFNPITYFMVNLVGEACEYACDEQVTKEMDMTDKKQYSTMILSMVCQSSPALSSNMIKNKKQLKRRFEMIMKKKRFSLFRTVICTVIMLALTCGSVVLANEVAPLVSSLLEDDYVYITNYGHGNYNEFVPVEKDGVYYLPLREFLNKSGIENDKIKYDNGNITIDVWSNEVGFGGRITFTDSGESVHENAEEVYPAKHIWSTECKINSKTVMVEDKEVQLTSVPYLENGITYVPYEYIRLLADYEETRIKNNFNDWTHKFIGNMKYGYDSLECEYYCDDVNVTSLPREKVYDENTLLATWAYHAINVDVSLKKTGYRTEFRAMFDYVSMNNPNDIGNAEIILNEVTRIYSNGSDIEGLFTVKVDDEIIYENKKGYITSLPLPSGKGIVDYGETIVEVGQANLGIYFFGFETGTDYNELCRENRIIAKKEDTKMLGLFPTEVKLDKNKVVQTGKSNYLQYNLNDKYSEIRLDFNEFLDKEHAWRYDYQITLSENSNIEVIDENTFSGHFFLTRNQTRIDSFDAMVTLLPDNKFEFRANDGRYIVRGTIGEFVPQWQWSEEQKNAPVPSVFMINE